ncbi:MAG: TetR family transcriptional regulator [Desulfuromonadales bacterium GWD2_61_12]|nr:MAG: TetR family transcriptional regulator [Desulfuromonadales bacterium GWC2_61_20]OGR33215.1 MAG: TetR family transcriptional regulator [Desulfuromonadales bacterium GWD2_61_12]HBT82015.1 TetR/AcrR family transcriptional regulator [Desulfuromonas sp.]
MTSKGETTKQKILADATPVFQIKGFTATTIGDLLAATGMTKGALYFHFPGKEAIGVEVFRKESATFMDFLDEVLTAETPAASLDNFFRAALGKHRDTGFVGGCFFGNTALEASDIFPVLSQMVAEVFDAWIEKIQAKIEAAQTLGEIRRDLPARQLAELVVATIEGGIMQSRLLKSELPMANSLSSLRVLLELRLRH